ncbi:hypothetical protein [Polaromonas sp.]|uniref:hypothetical protein n=1 Tax=Polaromonas sp. TaxID=1869339 RepID=UPI0037526A07
MQPRHSPLLLSLNGPMLYTGTALGAVFSGALLEHVQFSQLGWVGMPFCLLALLTLAFEPAQARQRAAVAS